MFVYVYDNNLLYWIYICVYMCTCIIYVCTISLITSFVTSNALTLMLMMVIRPFVHTIIWSLLLLCCCMNVCMCEICINVRFGVRLLFVLFWYINPLCMYPDAICFFENTMKNVHLRYFVILYTIFNSLLETIFDVSSSMMIVWYWWWKNHNKISCDEWMKFP